MLENKNILVTGGAGFIGSHLVERLYKNNRIVIIDNLRYGDKKNIKGFDNILIEENIADINLVDILGRYRIEYVFHLASHHLDDSLKEPMEDFRTSALGGLNVLESCRQVGVKRLVYSSTGSVYGEPKKPGYDESHELLPCVPYGVSKATTDHYARIYHTLYGLETVRVRYYNIYGPRRTAGAIPQFILTALNGGTIRIEGGDQIRTPTHVKDAVEATLLGAMVKEAAGKAFNISASESISIKEMAELIVKLCGKNDVGFEYTDYRPGEIMDLRPDNTYASNVLGWKSQVSLEQGFNDLVNTLKISLK